ncbi:hypothetical protein AGDE_13821 [Angomonas deanei]|nr:hypothetical protein AGDE_13821 [Angomonas deanei]|eukprot:EPY21724.1 hypothetical protein AGDE_13821 [Angomonas deanei]
MIAILWGRQGMDVDVLTRQLERNLRRLRPFLLEMTHVFDMVEKGLTSKILLTQRRAMLHQQKRKVTRSKGEREFPREPFDTLEEETAIPTTQQIQLLQTYELYDSLVLLPCLAPHFGATVQVVPTSLLIHAVVNEFSDVLLIGGASESGSEKFRLDAAAL